jgi:hypothetical protein
LNYLPFDFDDIGQIFLHVGVRAMGILPGKIFTDAIRGDQGNFHGLGR